MPALPEATGTTGFNTFYILLMDNQVQLKYDLMHIAETQDPIFIYMVIF